MKKFLLAVLASIFVLQLASCASADIYLGDQILDGESVVSLNNEEVFDGGVSIVATDGAYIRSGQYANMTPAELPQSGYYFIKNDGPETTRHVIVKYDISSFNIPDEAQTVYAVVNFYSTSPIHPTLTETEIYINAYKESANWDSKTVTYASLPALSESNLIGKTPLIKGDVFIDITDYFYECRANGAKEIAIRLVPSLRTVAEMRVSTVDSKLAPKLVAKESETRAFYQPKLLVDETANKAIWDYAKKTYDEWKVRYDAIVAKGDYPTSPITIDKSEYTFKTHASHNEANLLKEYDFDTRLATTLDGFKANTEDVKLDTFGGIISGTRYESTGYFYTKKIADRWITVDPLGYPCYITGINHAVYAYSASDYQTKAMVRVFGSSEKWALSTTRWFKNDLGFNVALGTPSDLLSIQNGISTTIYTPGVSQYAASVGLNSSDGGQTNFLYNDAMPVFDPAFKTYIEEATPKAIATYAENPYVIGYISDNELPTHHSMLTDYITLDPSISANHYSYACAWTWLTEFTGKKGEEIDVYKIDELNKASDVDLFLLFKGFVYDKYYSVMQPAIKAVCPNQLYLGVRLLTGTNWGEWVGRFGGYWCDIVCINYYGAWEIEPERIENLQKWLGKPFMITEFYAKGADAKGADGKYFVNTDGAGWLCKTQTDRGHFYQNFTLRLLESKNCVGWLYFQYIDNDPTDETIEKGQSNSNKGIVNSDHDREIYKAYHSQIGLINNNKYSLIEYFDGVDYFK